MINFWNIISLGLSRILPPRNKAIGSLWVFKIKLKSDEMIKSRLVALGHKDIAGEDYNKIYVLVAKIVTFLCFLTLLQLNVVGSCVTWM